MRRLPRLAVLAAAVFRDVSHWAGAIERIGGDQILQAIGAHLAKHIPHALAFKLEHATGIAALQHLEGGAVVKCKLIEIDIDSLAREELHGALQDRKRGQAEEVE